MFKAWQKPTILAAIMGADQGDTQTHAYALLGQPGPKPGHI
jgi:hypothetical protein